MLGRTIALRGGVLSIIGVTPPSFFGETVGERPDAWVPLAMQATVLPGRDWLHDQPGSVEKVMWLHVFGRLRPGVSRERAQADANVIFQQGLAALLRVAGRRGDAQAFLDQRLALKPAATGASSLRGNFAEPLFVLLGAAGLVLLIACSNLGQPAAGAHDGARTARWRCAWRSARAAARLVRQLLTESLCLAMAGGLAGLALALVLRAGLLDLVSDTAIALPAAARPSRARVRVPADARGRADARPAAGAARHEDAKHSQGCANRAAASPDRPPGCASASVVVVGQLALSLPLLVGAGLLVRTLFNLQRVDLGYARDGVLTVRVDAQAAGYDAGTPDGRRSRRCWRASARCRAFAPPPTRTTGSSAAPTTAIRSRSKATRRRATATADRATTRSAPATSRRSASRCCSAARSPTQDRAGGRTVCVINETFAKRFFERPEPDRPARHAAVRRADRHTYEVVGVVRDSRQNRLRGEIEHRFYTPATQPAASISAVTLHRAAARRRRRGAAGGCGASCSRPSRDMPIARAGDARRGHRTPARRRIGCSRSSRSPSASSRLLLAAIGLYGVLSYGVARRTQRDRHPQGARRAATRRSIGMILRETGWLLLVGLVAGTAVSAGAVRLIASRLYGLSPADPVTFGSPSPASPAWRRWPTWLPAYRASRVDPLVALRHE